MPPRSEQDFLYFIKNLKKTGISYVDMKTKFQTPIKGWEDSIRKADIDRAVEKGILVKHGTKWKVDKKKLDEFYNRQLYFKKGALF